MYGENVWYKQTSKPLAEVLIQKPSLRKKMQRSMLKQNKLMIGL